MSDQSSAYALRFISGKYQGGQFSLPQDGSIIIGRSSDVAVVLVEDMVSRHHARITVSDDVIKLEDMGSTNGCFVNGEKVKSSKLRVGDRVLVGTSIIKLVEASSGGSVGMSTVSASHTGRQTAQQVKTMSGDIGQVPLPDLFQLLSASRKTGVLVVQTDRDVGRVHFRMGQVVYATVNDEAGVEPTKAIFRILGWNAGSFELDREEPGQTFPSEISMSTEALLMESMRQVDEWRRVAVDLPPVESQLRIAKPLPGRLRELGPVELDTFELAMTYGRVENVLDHSEHDDATTGSALADLVKSGFLIVE